MANLDYETPEEREGHLTPDERAYPLRPYIAAPSTIPETAWLADYQYMVDFANDGYFGHALSDISEYVLTSEWQSGRPSGAPERDAAGSCSLKLDNSTAIFSTFNESSPLYGLIFPGLLVRIQMRINDGDWVSMWQGRLRSINPQVGEVTAVSTATLTGDGEFVRIGEVTADIDLLRNVTTGEAAEELLEAAGVTELQRDVDAGQTTLAKFWQERGLKLLETLWQLQDAEMGRVRESKDGKIVFEDRGRLFGQEIQATYGDGTLYMWSIQQMDHLRGIYNRYAAEIRALNKTESIILSTVCDVASGSGAEPPLIAAGVGSPVDPGTITVYFMFPPASSSYIALDTWGIVDYAANSQADGAGTDLTAFVSAVRTEEGQNLKVEFSNAALVPAYLTLLRVHGVAIAEGDPISILSEDAASQAKYGTRNYPYPSRWLSDATSGKAVADYAVTLNKDPNPSLMFSNKANYDVTHLAEVQRCELGDKIRVVAGAPYGLYIEKDFIVDRMFHRVDQFRMHEMSLVCTLAPTVQLIGTGEADSDKTIGEERKYTIVSSLPSPGDQGRVVLLRTDNKLYRDTGTAWVSDSDVSSIATLSLIGQMMVFGSVNGKVIQPFTGSGIAKLTAGVLSAVTEPAGDLVGTTAAQMLTNKTLTQPAIGNFTSAGHNHQNAAGGGTLSTSAITGLADLIAAAIVAAEAMSLPAADLSATGRKTAAIVAGGSITAMDLCVLNGSGKWIQADADDPDTSAGFISVALEAKSADEAMSVALPGSFIRNDAWSWTPGAVLYVSTSPGAIAESQPAEEDDVSRVIGFAVSAHVIYLQPSGMYFTHAAVE